MQTVIIAMLVGSGLGVGPGGRMPGRGRREACAGQALVRASDAAPVSLVASAVPCSSSPISP